MRIGVSTFDLVGTSAPRPVPQWLPPIGGLGAATVVACFACRWPVVHSLSTRDLIGEAAGNVLEVFFANVVTVWALNAIVPRAIGINVCPDVRLNVRPLILRTSLAALWLTPLALFIRENSPWAMAAAVVLVASIVQSFHLLFRANPYEGAHAIEESPLLALNRNPLSVPQSSPGLRRQILGVGAAFCAQTGALAAFAGYPSTATVLMGIATAFWTWSFTGDAPPDAGQYCWPSHSSSRPLLILALAILFTAAGLIPYLQHSYGIRGLGVPSRYHAHRRYPQGERRGQPDPEKKSEGSLLPETQGDPGVILVPEKLTHVKLLAPVPTIENGLLRNHRSTNPLVIPFDGVYWFFKAPDQHPPRTSRQAHGSPEMLNIRSTDRRPLSMEAHENLGNMIELGGCSRIQVAIRNADHYPETVSLELVLINTRAPGKPAQSLGKVMVKSTRPWKLYDEPAPAASETLDFVLPAKSSLRRFDEVSIVFRIDPARADAGPKMAIDHLVLVLRGL
jgi:hypothetical protein